MSAAMDAERWMMDALDGTLDAHDMALFLMYLDQHPDQRILYERMERLDRVLRAEPGVTIPARLPAQVMDAVKHTYLSQQVLLAPQITFLIVTGCALFMMGALALLVAYTGLSPDFPFTELNTLKMLAATAEAVAVDVLKIAVSFVRIAVSQPITWIIALVLLAVVTAWLRIMAGVFSHRPAPVPA